jgi:hypothetical protein
VYGTPDPVGMNPSPGYCTPPQPNSIRLTASASINTHGGVDMPTQVLVDWRVDVPNGPSGTGEMFGQPDTWSYTLPAIPWGSAWDDGGKIVLTVRLYDQFGLIQTKVGSAALARCDRFIIG